jgi:hypothetical protein
VSKDEHELLIVHVPALVAVLLDHEKRKGQPLSLPEVLEIRDGAEAIAMPAFARDRVAEERGYDDIDPENVWNEWQAIRLEFFRDGFLP